jgi:hypothetical protein
MEKELVAPKDRVLTTNRSKAVIFQNIFSVM